MVFSPSLKGLGRATGGGSHHYSDAEEAAVLLSWSF